MKVEKSELIEFVTALGENCGNSKKLEWYHGLLSDIETAWPEAEVNEINLSEKVKILEGKVDKLSALHTVFGPPPVDDEKDSAELEHYFKSLKSKPE